MKKQERLDLVEWTNDFTRKNGAQEVAITFSNQREIDIEYRDSKLDKLTEATQNSLYIQIYINQRFSSHSTNDLKKGSLKRFLKEAIDSTKYLNIDEYRSLPNPQYYPKCSDKDLKIYDKNYHSIESSARIDLAKQIEYSAKSQSDKIISTTAGYSDVVYQTVRLHSNGFLGETEGTMFSAGAEVTVKDGEKGRPADYYYASVRFHENLPNAEEMGEKAAQRALQKIGQAKIDSGKYDMIVENRCCSRAYSLFQGPMTARALQQKSSFLDGKLGKQIASEKLSVYDDPYLEKGLSSRLFDTEGLGTQRRTWIKNGVLQNFYIDNYYGKKLQMEPTNGSPTNLFFETGTKSLDQMINNIKRGILISGFLGGNSNPTTGDFSFGIVGFLIENGEIAKPINEMNISGNAKEFWKQLVEVGNDPNPFSSILIPSMMFEGVQFSGI